jgi:hypothetical protein
MRRRCITWQEGIVVTERAETSDFALTRSEYSTNPHGWSVQQKRPTASNKYPDPKYLFFIYIRLVDNKLEVSHEYDKITGSVSSTEIGLLKRARDTTNSYSKNFADLKWKRPCYVTIVVDIPGWRLQWGPRGLDPFAFRSSKDVLKGGEIKPQYYDPNYSFLEAEKIYHLPGEKENTLIPGNATVRCINFCKEDELGQDMTGTQVRSYCFEIYVLVPFSQADSYVTVLIDPDGQNQGPNTL